MIIGYTGFAVYVGDELSPWAGLYSLTKGNTYRFFQGRFIDDIGRKSSIRFPSGVELRANGFKAVSV